MELAVTLMCLPCRGDLHHHLGTLKSDLGSIGLLILDLSSINNHLLGQSQALVFKKTFWHKESYRYEAYKHLKPAISPWW